jgi:hypothetical protein
MVVMVTRPWFVAAAVLIPLACGGNVVVDGANANGGAYATGAGGTGASNTGASGAGGGTLLPNCPLSQCSVPDCASAIMAGGRPCYGDPAEVQHYADLVACANAQCEPACAALVSNCSSVPVGCWNCVQMLCATQVATCVMGGGTSGAGGSATCTQQCTSSCADALTNGGRPCSTNATAASDYDALAKCTKQCSCSSFYNGCAPLDTDPPCTDCVMLNCTWQYGTCASN